MQQDAPQLPQSPAALDYAPRSLRRVHYARHSLPVLAAFTITGVVVFAALGAVIGAAIAPALFSDAIKYEQRGGSIATNRLDAYHHFALFVCVGCAASGAAAGCGFYVAWRNRQTSA